MCFRSKKQVEPVKDKVVADNADLPRQLNKDTATRKVTCPRCAHVFNPDLNKRRNHGFEQEFVVCPQCRLIISHLEEAIREAETKKRIAENKRQAFQKRIRWFASITPAGTVFPDGRRIVSRERVNRDVVEESWILDKGCNLDGLVRFLIGALDKLTVCQLDYSPYNQVRFLYSSDPEQIGQTLGPFRWLPVSRQITIRKSRLLWEIAVEYDLPKSAEQTEK